jgi:hypothetical protein
MQDRYELIELTDSELDAVAGGNPFEIKAFKSTVTQTVSFNNSSTNTITAIIDNSVNISGEPEM